MTFKLKIWTIKHSDGVVVTDTDRVVEVWRKYCEDLYILRTKILNPKSTLLISEEVSIKAK